MMEPSTKAAVLDMGRKGRNVVEWSWPALDRIERHVLAENLGADPVGRDLLQLYRDAVKFEDLLARAPKPSLAGGEYAGDDACKVCHATAHDIWAKSAHGRAWATLVNSGDASDPECVRCHVVGFGQDGGFDAATLVPVNVQCEACHGPSKAHVETRGPTPRTKPDRSFCIGCHDLENSPHFEFDVYWPKIRHGNEPK
jgi:hypothetical protein